MRHKLTTFIVKNPPKSKKAGKGRKAVAGADSIAGQPGGGKVEGEDDESDDELTKKIEAGAAQIMSEEQAQALIAQREKEDDWSIDTSKEAVAARVQSLDSKLQNSLVLEDDDEEGGGPYETFGEWVKEQREGEEGVTDADIYKKAEEMGIAKKHKILVVLVQALFTEKIVEEIASHVPLFGKVSSCCTARVDEVRVELTVSRSTSSLLASLPPCFHTARSPLFPCFARYSRLNPSPPSSPYPARPFHHTHHQLTTSEKHQKSLLGGIERFVGEVHPDLIASIPKILMAFYQADILEEEVLTQWGTHVSKKVSSLALARASPLLPTSFFISSRRFLELLEVEHDADCACLHSNSTSPRTSPRRSARLPSLSSSGSPKPTRTRRAMMSKLARLSRGCYSYYHTTQLHTLASFPSPYFPCALWSFPSFSFLCNTSRLTAPAHLSRVQRAHQVPRTAAKHRLRRRTPPSRFRLQRSSAEVHLSRFPLLQIVSSSSSFVHSSLTLYRRPL